MFTKTRRRNLMNISILQTEEQICAVFVAGTILAIACSRLFIPLSPRIHRTTSQNRLMGGADVTTIRRLFAGEKRLAAKTVPNSWESDCDVYFSVQDC